MKDRSNITIYYDADCPTCTLYKEASEQPDSTWQPNSGNEKEIIVEQNGNILRNIEAVAAIEQMKGNDRRAKILRNPILKPFFKIGYRIIAQYRRVILGPKATFFWIKTTIGLGLLCASLASWRLWFTWHDFPAAPLLGGVGNGLYTISNVFGFIYFGLLLALIFTRRHTKIITLLLIGISTLMILGDLNRLRPWLYQLLLLLGALNLSKTEKSLPFSFLLVFASTYFWGGLQKLNSYFLEEIWPWFISPVTQLIPLHTPIITALGVIVICIEISIGLLILKGRGVAAAILATLTHLTIVTLLPIGHQWGFVVLFWNLALLAIAWIVKKQRFTIESKTAVAVVILLSWILPIGNWFGIWDNYLSGALYAHETDRGYIVVSNEDTSLLPANAQNNLISWNEAESAIDTLMWSYDNYNTVLYTSDRAYIAALQEICELTDATLYLRAKKRHFRTLPGQIISCDTLHKQE